MAETKVAHDIESSISRAMIARVSDFKQKADTLTLEGVRRVLEQDLGLDKFVLDAHKKFIKQALQECFYATKDENGHENLGEMHQEVLDSKEEGITTPVQPQKKTKLSTVGDGEKLKEGISSMKMDASEHVPEQNSGKYDPVNFEELIKKTIRKRASHFRANSEKITLSGVRRLLEEDLGLNKNELDVHKKFISEELDKALQLPEVESKPSNKKKKLTKGSPEIHQKNNSRSPKEDASSASSESDVSRSEEELVKPKRKTSKYGKMKSDEGLKKRKWTAEDKKTSTKEKNKRTKLMTEKTSDSENTENSDDQSSSSSEEIPKKKNLTSTQIYGKQVEHLKSIIKSSGMSVPPSVYKRAKQAPENKRESALIKELKEILEREGLSTNSSEKEIKTVRRKKDRARELEGIDMSNIVSSSRRRSTSSYIAAKPQVPIVSDEEDEEQEETDDDNISEEASEESDEGLQMLEKVSIAPMMSLRWSIAERSSK